MATTSKVPEATLAFWITKVLATTLGETAGDAVTMSMHAGYLLGTAIFGALFLVAVAAQSRASTFRPGLYWLAMVGATTVGTTMADFADRSLGIGYPGGASLLFALLMASFFAWHRATGSLQLGSVSGGKSEFFYWLTIMCSQTLGTALGDWTADSLGLGYAGGALVFGALLLALWLLYRWTALSRIALFWAAFVLTRNSRFKCRTQFGGLVTAPLVMPVVITGLSLLLLFVAMAQMIGTQPFHAVTFAGKRYDCGSKTGFVEATLAIALQRPDMAEDVRAMMQRLLAEG